MTRTTLKALWFGGGGILATWIAVSPAQDVPVTTPTTAVRRPAVGIEPTAEQLNEQATRLRDRTRAVTLRPSTRNPFRYASPKSSAASRAARAPGEQPMVIEPTIPTAPPPPALKLSGVAQKAGKRTAIIYGDGQIYLVGEGESVAGRYTVINVDPEAVLLRDASGAEQRLVLPQ
jgi:hypothetical protein